jgi:prohibitin 1
MSRLPRLLFGLTTAALVGNVCLYNVDAGQRAVIFKRFGGGIQQYTVGEGTHFLIPGLHRAFIMDVRTQPRNIATITGTKDLQTVNLSLRVLTRPRLDKLPRIFSELGLDYNDRVLPSICNEVLKAVVALYDAAELLTMRDQVSLQIRDALQVRAREFDIELDDVSITHLAFSKDFSKAIEDKQVAEQMAERAKFVVAKSEQEQLALIIRSEGDAEAATLVSQALSQAGKGLIELRRIETAIQIAETLATNPGVSYLPGASGTDGASKPQLLLSVPR